MDVDVNVDLIVLFVVVVVVVAAVVVVVVVAVGGGKKSRKALNELSNVNVSMSYLFRGQLCLLLLKLNKWNSSIEFDFL